MLGVWVFFAMIVADFEVFLWVFLINQLYFPLALVGYEINLANSALRASLVIIISYPTCAREMTDTLYTLRRDHCTSQTDFEM